MRKAGKILSLLCFVAAVVLVVLAVADKAPYWAAARDSEELIAQYTQPVENQEEKEEREEAAKPAASSSVPETSATVSPERPASEEFLEEDLPANRLGRASRAKLRYCGMDVYSGNPCGLPYSDWRE